LTPRRVVRLTALSLAAIACLVGCGQAKPSSDQPRTETVPIEGVGEPIGGSVAPLAQCRDWRDGTVQERMATIEDIRGQLTPQTSPSEDSGLPDQDAYELFQRVCARKYASAFRLYKVYTQRAGFEPLEP
jgi:hypothetical protein